MTSASPSATALRTVRKIFRAHSQKEGAGFIVQRPFPSLQISDEDTDPFLMIDEFGPKNVAPRGPGAPWHPHRGFDTVTYLKAGQSAHQDSMGNSGIVRAGEVQWMRAASGVIHDEGRDHPGGLSHGFQLWVNLPRALKMSEPSYQQLSKESFDWKPLQTLDSVGCRVKVISGEIVQASSPLASSAATEAEAAASVPKLSSPLQAMAVPLLIADVEVDPKGTSVIPIPDSMETAIVYIYKGRARVFNGARDASGTPVGRQDAIIFSLSGEGGIKITGDSATQGTGGDSASGGDEDLTKAYASGAEGGVSFVLLAGQRIKEPIARHGPFVMNTREEIEQAIKDYQNGELVKTKASSTTY